MTATQPLPRSILLCQAGARHTYAMARALDARGALSSFHTDLGIHEETAKRWPALASMLRMAGAGRRRIAGIDPSRLKTHWHAGLLPRLTPGLAQWRRDSWEEALLGHAVATADIAAADAILVLLGSAHDVARRAKILGKPVLSEIFITPEAGRIETDLRRQWPGWEDEGTDGHERLAAMVAQLAAQSDVLICPSAFVADGIRKLGLTTPVEIVPYANSLHVTQASSPVRGRILFAGSANLRKGIAWLALAAQFIKRKYPHSEFIVAGPVSDTIRGRPECAALTFLGAVPPARLLQEYALADMLVLPTCAEGSASVVFEAMAGGAPVITTHESGSVCQHEFDALIIPSQDERALIAAMERLLEDRNLRDRLAANARTSAHRFTFSHWAARINAIVDRELDEVA